MRLEATYKYKKRIDARTSLAERKAQEDADMPVDPLDDLFTNSWNFFGTIMGKLLIPVMKHKYHEQSTYNTNQLFSLTH